MLDNRDRINLLMMKMSGTVLTTLAIIGYLDSVSKFASLLRLHITALALLLLVVALLGYSVYLYKMMTDSSGDATLLNHLFMLMAFQNQIRASLIFYCIIAETFSLEKDNTFYIIVHDCLMFFTIWTTWNVLFIACTTFSKNWSPESYLELSQHSQIVFKIIFVTEVVLTFTVFFTGILKCENETKCLRRHFIKLMLPIGMAALFILVKVTQDNYSIMRRMKSRIVSTVRRLNNSVTPDVEGAGIGNNENTSNTGVNGNQVSFI